MRTVALLVSPFILAGCVVPNQAYPVAYGPISQYRDMEAAVEFVVLNFERNYSIGETMSASVGDTMVRVRELHRQYRAPIIATAVDDFTIIIDGTELNYSAGSNFDSYGLDQRSSVLLFRMNEYQVHTDQDGCLTGEATPTDGAYGVPSVSASTESQVCLSITEGEPQRLAETQGTTNFELIYSGSDAQTLRITYREYTSEDMARSAFFQELTYPADISSIRFRDYEISIVSRGDGEVSYEVAADGGLEALDGTRLTENWTQIASSRQSAQAGK